MVAQGPRRSRGEAALLTRGPASGVCKRALSFVTTSRKSGRHSWQGVMQRSAFHRAAAARSSV